MDRNPARRPDRLLGALIAGLLASPHALVSLAVLFGPLAAVDGMPSWFSGRPLPVVIGVFAAGYSGYRLSFLRATTRRALAALTATCATLVSVSALSGFLVHRDFFSAAFQYVLGAPVALLYYFVSRMSIDRIPFRRETARSVGSAGYVIAGFYGMWVMMMGYAISTRAEPRPVESMLYNVLNLCLIFALVFLSRDIRLRGRTCVETSGDGLLLDGKDVLPAFGAKKASVFHAFAASADRTLRCAEINALLSRDGAERAECAQCSGENTKAALCKRYRTTYNVILELKKTLELLEIGSVMSSENRRLILTEGWRLVLFEGVRLVARKKKTGRGIIDPLPASIIL